MSWKPPQYPDDYTGYRYTNPGSTPLPITKETMIAALEEGRAARAAVPPGGYRPPNPYAGRSMTLDWLWRSGYDEQDAPRLAELGELYDEMVAAGEIQPTP